MKITHSLTSEELDAVDAHLLFLARAAEQDGRHCHSGGLETARTFLASTRRESFIRRLKEREAKLTAEIERKAPGYFSTPLTK